MTTGNNACTNLASHCWHDRGERVCCYCGKVQRLLPSFAPFKGHGPYSPPTYRGSMTDSVPPAAPACHVCKGTGRYTNFDLTPEEAEQPCPTCNGTGRAAPACPECGAPCVPMTHLDLSPGFRYVGGIEPAPARGTPSEAQIRAALKAWPDTLALPDENELRAIVEAANRAEWPDAVRVAPART